MKPVRLSTHARDRAEQRGATEEDVVAAVSEGQWGPADRGRLEAEKAFPYDAEWNGKRYKIKRVRPIFVEEDETIVVVTVYVYYHDEEVGQ